MKKTIQITTDQLQQIIKEGVSKLHKQTLIENRIKQINEELEMMGEDFDSTAWQEKQNSMMDIQDVEGYEMEQKFKTIKDKLKIYGVFDKDDEFSDWNLDLMLYSVGKILPENKLQSDLLLNEAFGDSRFYQIDLKKINAYNQKELGEIKKQFDIEGLVNRKNMGYGFHGMSLKKIAEHIKEAFINIGLTEPLTLDYFIN